jgi:signal transduction histidine kinase
MKKFSIYIYSKLLSILLICSISFNTIAQTLKNFQQYNYLDTVNNSEERIKVISKFYYSHTKKDLLKLELTWRMGAYATSNDSTAFYLNKAIILCDELKNSELLPTLYYRKAVNAYNTFDRATALKYFQIGLFYAKQLKQIKQSYTLTSAVGTIYFELHQYDSAKIYLEQALGEIKQADSLLTDQGLLTTRIYGTYLHSQHKYDQAAKIYKNVIDVCVQKKKFESAYGGAMACYAQVLGDMKLYDSAFNYLNQMQVLDSATSLAKNKSMYSTIRGRIFESQKKYDSAYYNIFDALNTQEADFTSLRNQEIAKYEAQLGNQLLEKDLKIARQKKQKWIAVAILLAALTILSYLIFYLYQKRKDVRQKLLQQKQRTTAIIEGEEKERMRLSRELHDGIGQDILAIRRILIQKGADQKDTNFLEKIGTDIRNLSHQLMPISLKMLGLKAAMEESLENLLASSDIVYSLDAKGLENRLSDQIEIALYRIFQELLQNIVKHSKAKSIFVQLVKKQDYILLLVEDDGCGMADETTSKKGIGIKNIQNRIEILNGELKYDSSKDEGTTAIIRIPLN